MDMDRSDSRDTFSAEASFSSGQDEDTNDAQGQPLPLFHVHHSQQETSERPNSPRATPVPEDQPPKIGIRNQNDDEV